MIFAIPMTRMKLFSAGLLLASLVSFVPAHAQSSNSSVVINQVQTGAASSTAQELISIYNNTDKPVDITNWCLTYATASDATQVSLTCLKPPDNKTHIYLKSYQSAVFATSEFTQIYTGVAPDATFTAGVSSSAGHIKLLNSTKEVIDVVGWGTAVKPEGTAIVAHPNGKLLQRKATQIPMLQDTNNNSADFTIADLQIPAPGGLYEEVVQPQCPPDAPLCKDVYPIISELLPDAEGSDTGNEFIELYNPSDHPINLKDYILQLGPSYAKSYQLPAITLDPHSYITYSDAQTGLALPNTSASVRLLNVFGDTVSESTYTNLEEGVAWALIDNVWYATYQPTPAQPNVRQEVKPCKIGYEYNEITEKCQKPIAATVPAACNANQVRNLETGRCRNITSIASAAVCKIGQEKNPATGRCKNVAATVDAKACPAGQQRNAETGRCRKILAAGGQAKVTDMPSPLVANTMKWWIAGVGALGAGGYALFEWRREVFSVLANLRSRFAPST